METRTVSGKVYALARSGRPMADSSSSTLTWTELLFSCLIARIYSDTHAYIFPPGSSLRGNLKRKAVLNWSYKTRKPAPNSPSASFLYGYYPLMFKVLYDTKIYSASIRILRRVAVPFIFFGRENSRCLNTLTHGSLRLIDAVFRSVYVVYYIYTPFANSSGLKIPNSTTIFSRVERKKKLLVSFFFFYKRTSQSVKGWKKLYKK